MRMPAAPPPIEALLAKQQASKLIQLLIGRSMVDEKGRYIHWDQLRWRPQPGNVSAEDAWLAIRVARASASTVLPLRAKSGEYFTYCEPAPLRGALRSIDMRSGGILATNESGLSRQDGKRYFARSLAEEPFASSYIEGAATTRQRAKQLIYEQRKPRTRDELMVLNNYLGMEFVKTIVDAPLSIDAICEVHRILTKDTLDRPEMAGVIRNSDDVFVEDASGEILHVPPPHVELRTRLQAICDFANAEDGPTKFMHPIVRAIIVHFMIAYEHPFVDGNGRTARALFYWAALRAGYWLIEYVSISSVIANAPIKYGRAFLYTETDRGDLTYFLNHQIAVLQTAIDNILDYAERRQKEVAEFEAKLSQMNSRKAFNARQSSLLNDLARMRMPYATLQDHQARYHVSYITARNDLEPLVKQGLLRKRKRGKQHLYFPASDLVGRLGVSGEAVSA